MPSHVMPTFTYRDAHAAIDVLVEAFGFERRAVYEQDGVIVHAELTFRDGMLMLGTTKDSDYDRLLTDPQAAGGRPTGGVYVVVEDVDALADRARRAGVEIVIDVADKDYGGRDVTIRDPGGYIWTFGDYDPWREH